jgi:uroporphyrinogen III methyltransferase/synthase
MILAALNVKYRDIKYAMPFGIQLWLFVTPIIYPSSIVPERFRFLISLNPLSGIIAAFRASMLPDRFVAEALLDAFDKTEQFQGQTYLLPRSDIARAELADGLRERGAKVIEVSAYRTLPEETLPDGILERIERDEVDLVTFSSSSTVTNFVNALPAKRRGAIIPHVRAASIGPVTSEALRNAGIPIVVTADESTISALAKAIGEHFNK